MSNSEPIAWLSKVLKGSLAGTIGFANPASKLNTELYEGPFPVFRHDQSEEIERLRAERDGLKAEIARLRAGGQVFKGELERLEEFKRQVRENRR